MGRRSPAARVSAALLLLAVLVACSFAHRERGVWLATLLALPWILLYLDAADVTLRILALWRARRAPDPSGDSLTPRAPSGWRAAAGIAPCAFVTAIRDLGTDVDEFIACHAALRDSFWIVDLDSRDSTARRLRAAGWRCAAAGPGVSGRVALARLVEDLPPEMATVVVLERGATLLTPIDAPETFARVLRDFQQGDADVLCPRPLAGASTATNLLAQAETALTYGLDGTALDTLAPLTATALYRRELLQALLSDPNGCCHADTLRALAAGARVRCEPRLEVRAPVLSFTTWLARRGREWRAVTAGLWFSRREVDAAARRDFLAFHHYLIRPIVFDLCAAPLRVPAAVVIVAGGIAACLTVAGVDGLSSPLADARLFAFVLLQYVFVYAVAGVVVARRGQRLSALLLTPVSLIFVLSRALAPLAPLLIADRGHRVAR